MSRQNVVERFAEQLHDRPARLLVVWNRVRSTVAPGFPWLPIVFFNHVRGWLYPLLPIACFAMALAVFRLAIELLCAVPITRDVYNTYVLWVVTSCHEYEAIAVFLIVIGILACSARFRHLFTANRARGSKLVGICYGVLLLFCGAYLTQPWALARYSPWISLPLLAVLLWLWIRSTWAYWGIMFRPTAWAIRSYLEDSLDGREYIDLMGRLRALQRRKMFQAGRRGERAAVRTGVHRRTPWTRYFVALARIFDNAESRGVIRRSIATACAQLTPRVPDALAADDALLVKELEYVVNQASAAAETLLYVDSPDDPLDGARRALLFQQYHRWQLAVDALVACHMFDFRDSDVAACPSSDAVHTDADERICLCVYAGATLLAQFARRLFLPSLSGRETITADNPLGLFWWHPEGLPGAFRKAGELVDFEIDALTWATHRTPINDRSVHHDELRRILAARSVHTWQRVCTLRLVVAQIVRSGLQLGTSDVASTSTPMTAGQRELWRNLESAIRTEIRPLIFDPSVSEELRKFAIETRFHYFDACLLNAEPQFQALRHEVEACENLWRGDVSENTDRWFQSHSYLHEAWSTGREDLRRDLYLNAATAIRRANSCARHTFHQVVEQSDRNWIGATATPSDQRPGPVVPEPPRYSCASVHGSWFRFFGMGRQPNLFSQSLLIPLWVLCSIGGAVLLHWNAAGSVLHAPDLRRGGEQLRQPVNFVDTGIEAKPSLWVATQGDGVHLKGGGNDHHWNRITAENSQRREWPGLPGNNVRCVQIDPRTNVISYLCEVEGRNVVAVSNYPWFSPGSVPYTAPNRWATFLGTSSFPGVSGTNITTAIQPDGCPLALFGTEGSGLGRYHVTERRWLDRAGPLNNWFDITINAANGFLLPGQDAVNDVAAIRTSDGWTTWLATQNGLAGGLVWPRDEDAFQPEARIGADDWQRIRGAELLGDRIEQVRLRTCLLESLPGQMTAGRNMGHAAEDDRLAEYVVVDYRSQRGGLATLIPGGPLVDHRHSVRVHDREVAGLEEQNLQRVIYSRPEGRIWAVDRVTPNWNRVSVYLEQTHEWKTESTVSARQVNDLAADRSCPGSVLLATESGIEALSDSGSDSLETRRHSFGDAKVHQVISSEKSFLGLATRRGESRPGVYELPRDDDGRLPGEAAQSVNKVIGPRRFPKDDLAMADLSCVTQSVVGDNLYFGTHDFGIGLIDRSSRDIHAPVNDRLRDLRVLDLCVIPDETGQRDQWLLQVTGGNQIDGVNLGTDQSGLVALFNHTSTKLRPDGLHAARPLHNDLFLGGFEHGTQKITAAKYSMRSHQWSPVGGGTSLAGLTGFHESNSRLWAHTFTPANLGSLYVLAEDEKSWIARQDGGIKPYAFDATPDQMLAVLRDNSIVAVHPDPKVDPTPVMAPLPTSYRAEPTHAAVAEGGDEDALYVGFGSTASHFNLRSWRWTDFKNPGQRQIKRLFANRAGLWLHDQAGDLFLLGRPGAANHSDKPLATGVDALDWDGDRVVLKTASGEVKLWQDQLRTLVGAPFDADLHTQTQAVLAWRGEDLCVAAGSKLGHYQFQSHSWRDVSPTGMSTIKKLVASEKYLYVLDASGQLQRSENLSEWEKVNSHFAQVLKDRPELSFPPAARQAAIEWIGDIDNGMGVIVAGLGAFTLFDDAPTAPVWLSAQSLGPPPEAEVSCAAEIGRELYLGTKDGDVWAYVAADDSRPNAPLAWQPLPASGGAVRKVVPGDSQHLLILTTNRVVMFQRDKTGSWGVATRQQLSVGVPEALAAVNGSAYWTERAPGGAIHFYVLKNCQGQPVRLVGGGTSPAASTVSVALDSEKRWLFRSDSLGKVARYEWDQRHWEPEDVGNSAGRQVKLFSLGKTVFAFSAGDERLYYRTDDARWQPFSIGGLPLSVRAITNDDDGILLLLTNGTLLYQSQLLSTPPQTLLVPESSGPAPAWQQGQLAETGDVLLVSDLERLAAYNRQTHAWSQVLAAPVDRFFPTLTEDGKPAWYARENVNQRLWYLTIDGQPQQVSKQLVALPAAAKTTVQHAGFGVQYPSVVTVVSNGRTRTLALAANGGVHELQQQRLQNSLIQPQPLRSTKSPTITAAAEWQSQLFVGLDDDGRYAVAVYSPAKMVWQRVDTVHRVRRFWPAGQNLLVELETGGSPPLQLVPIEADAQQNCILQIKQSIDAFDVAKDPNGNRIWIIGADRRVRRIKPDEGIIGVSATDTDVLPARIIAAHAIERDLFALLEDGTVWQYSLEHLSWRKSLPENGQPGPGTPARIASLIDSNGNLIAQGLTHAGETGYWQCVDGKWTALSPSATGEIQLPFAARDRQRDVWKLTSTGGKLQFEWTHDVNQPRAHVHTTTNANDHERFDFNHFTRLQWRAGELWCETLAATHDRRPVHRRFWVGEADARQNPAQVALERDQLGDVGMARFMIDRDDAFQSLTDDSPFTVNGADFQVAEHDTGSWQSEDKTKRVQVWLKPAGVSPIPVTLMPSSEGLWTLDIDRWHAVHADRAFVHVATDRGVLTVTVSDLLAGRIRRQAFQRATAPIRFVEHAGHNYASDANQLFRFDATLSTWSPIPRDEEVMRAFHEDATVSSSTRHRHLKNWRVVGSGPWKLQMLPRPQAASQDPLVSFVDVSLDRQGFGFDQARAMQLTPDSIVLYGVDGRTRYPRLSPAGPPTAIDSAYATPVKQLMGLEEFLNRQLLIGEAGIWLFAETGGWRKLDASAEALLRERMNGIVFRHGPWQWNRDESVQVGVAPFTSDQPLSTWFDLKTGQFAHDRVQDLTALNNRLMAATPAGVALWDEGILKSVDPTAKAAQNSQASLEFLRSHAGTQTLLVKPQDHAATHVFEYSDTWHPATNPTDEILRQHAQVLLHGQHWQVSLPLAGENAHMGRLQFLCTVPSGQTFRRTWAESRSWHLDRVNGMCSAEKRTILATDAGLYDPLSSHVAESSQPHQRIEYVDGALHVLRGGVDSWYDVQNLQPLKREGATFAESDRWLLTSDRWQWIRTAASGRIHILVRPNLKSPRIESTFSDGRFDFDHVHGVLIDDPQTLLATRKGFHWLSADGSFELANSAVLPTSQAPSVRLFALWLDGARRRFVGIGEMLYERSAKWTPVTDAHRIDLINREATSQMARNKRWHVSRQKATAQRIQLTTGTSPPQTVSFAPEQGTFKFCLVLGISKLADQDALIAATHEGLAEVRFKTGFHSITSEFSEGSSPATPFTAVRVWRTSAGIIARIRMSSGTSQFCQLVQQSWKPIGDQEATKLIEESLRMVNDKWTVERLSTADFEPKRNSHGEVDGQNVLPSAFRLQWNNQRLRLRSKNAEATPEGTVFAHDIAVSVCWDKRSTANGDEEDVWVASEGGVVRMKTVDNRLLGPDDAHLWTNQFDGQAPFKIQRVSARNRIVCRMRRMSHDLLVWDPESSTWASEELQAEDEEPISRDNLWRWHLSPDRKMRILPDPKTFNIRSPRQQQHFNRDYAWFHAGSLACWSINADTLDEDRIAVESGDLFVATAGGILRLSTDRARAEQVYVFDSDGTPLFGTTAVIELTRDPDSAKIYGHTAGTSRVNYRYDSAADVWRKVSYDFPGRLRTVTTSWLSFRHDNPQQAVPQFASNVSDTLFSPNFRLLSRGRFTFDVVRDFIWDNPHASEPPGHWLLTDAGVVRLDSSGTIRRHYARSFESPARLRSLHLESDGLKICQDDAVVWEEQSSGGWRRNESRSTVRRLRTSVRNNLMSWIGAGDSQYDVRLAALPNLSFPSDDSLSPLLQNGVFLFDDVRDMRFEDDVLLIAARASIWEYSCTQVRQLVSGDESAQTRLARMPSAVTLLMASDRPSAVAASAELIEPRWFLDGPPNLQLLTSNPTGAFERKGDGKWQRRAPCDPNQVELSDGRHRWRLTVQDGELAGENLSSDRSGRISRISIAGGITPKLAGSAMTNDAIWVPLRSGLLWIRKNKLDEMR